MTLWANRAPTSRPHAARGLLLLALILFATFLAYQPSLKGELTNLDDNQYITESPYIGLDWRNVTKIFSSYYMGNYHPLAMLSLSLDHARGQLNPRPYHATNIALHLLNTALCCWLVSRLIAGHLRNQTGRVDRRFVLDVALFAAALFGLHTLHVESVAWISERKDVLYALFYLSALIAYTYHLGETGSRRKTWLLLLTALFFVASLLSKAQAVVLPLSLLAVDHLMGHRVFDGKRLLRNVWFFAMSALFGVVAIQAQQSVKSIIYESPWSLWHRLVFACYSYVSYLWKLLIPLKLSALYPYPPHQSGSLPGSYYFYPVVAALLAAVVVLFSKKSRIATFGALFFTFNIMMLLQVLPVGRAMMADRYAYVASIGFFLVLAYGCRAAAERHPRFKPLVVGLGLIYLGWLGALTYERCATVWQSSLALWENVLERSPDSAWALDNYGVALSNAHPPDYPRALASFNRAIALDPASDQSYYNRGVVKAALARARTAASPEGGAGTQATERQRGLREEAVGDFTTAIGLRAANPKAYLNRGATQFESGNHEAAIADFDKAIALRPSWPLALSNRGSAKAVLADLKAQDLQRQGKPDMAVHYRNTTKMSALEDFNRALTMDPDNAGVQYLRGITYLSLGNKQAGCDDLRSALRRGYQQAATRLQASCQGP